MYVIAVIEHRTRRILTVLYDTYCAATDKRANSEFEKLAD